MIADGRRQKRLGAIERWSSRTAVGAGVVAAVTGGLGLLEAAVASGCIAAVSPVIGQIASNRLRRAAKAASDARVAAAEQVLHDLRQRLGPRHITPEQTATIAQLLNSVPPFAVGVNHNRQEVEQSEYSEQIRAALRAGGVEAGWFGGATNATQAWRSADPTSRTSASS